MSTPAVTLRAAAAELERTADHGVCECATCHARRAARTRAVAGLLLSIAVEFDWIDDMDSLKDVLAAALVVAGTIDQPDEESA